MAGKVLVAQRPQSLPYNLHRNSGAVVHVGNSRSGVVEIGGDTWRPGSLVMWLSSIFSQKLCLKNISRVESD